jgi:hypothetical protein
MLQLEEKWRIAQACFPETAAEGMEYWHDAKPVKFGELVSWTAGTVSLASYQIPLDSAYLLISRVECYTTTFVAAAPGFGQFSPPPQGQAFWQFIEGITDILRVTPQVPIHVLCDTDEYIVAKGDQQIALRAILPAPPDANARFVRTLVYGYLIGSIVADRIGDSESVYFGAST